MIENKANINQPLEKASSCLSNLSDSFAPDGKTDTALLIEKYKEVITEKDIELKQYKESNALLEKFAISVAHDIKSPIRTISSFTKLLELHMKSEEPQDPERMEEFLQFIQQATADLGEMVDETLSKAKVGNRIIANETFSCRELLESVVKKLKVEIEESGSVVVFKNLAIEICSNRLMLDSVFQNLVMNAIKFRKEKQAADIQISSLDRKDYWLFTIADKGIGIPKGKIDLIFCPFVKLDEKTEGIGLGLSHCKTTLKELGGDIWLESEEGVGSVFYLRLPKG